MSKFAYAVAAAALAGLVVACMPVLYAVRVAQGELSLPPLVKARVGELAIVTADTVSPVQFWTDAPGAYIDAGRRTVIFSSARPGEFRVLAWSVRWFKPTTAQLCTVVVGGEAPTPPGPTPPGPTPPGPVPPPPPPISPLAHKLKAAYQMDRQAGVGTAEQAAKLAELYRQAAERTPGQTELKTLADLHGVLRRSALALIGDAALPGLRGEIAGYLKTMLPTKGEAQLTPSLRETAARVFLELSQALGEIQ